MYPDEWRRLFLSYIEFTSVGEYTYAEGHDPDIKEVKGYLYIDPRTGCLCVRVEDVYVELKPDVIEAWTGDNKEKITPFLDE